MKKKNLIDIKDKFDFVTEEHRDIQLKCLITIVGGTLGRIAGA